MVEFGQNLERVLERLAASVNAERDRRIAAGFLFQGTSFDFDTDSVVNIAGAGASAGVALSLGSASGDLRWADSNSDFVWISQENTLVPMDAQTCFAFSQAAMRHKRAHIFAARIIKDMNPIPADFTNDVYWP